MAGPKYDKYDPISGGFRAKLNAALTLTDGSFFGGVSLNATGKVVVGAGGQSGLVGVCIKNVAGQSIDGNQSLSLAPGTPNPYAPIGAQPNDAVDIMTSGEIVGLDKTAFPAGTKVYTSAAGVISTSAATGARQIGWTAEAGRLIVRVPTGIAAT